MSQYFPLICSYGLWAYYPPYPTTTSPPTTTTTQGVFRDIY